MRITCFLFAIAALLAMLGCKGPEAKEKALVEWRLNEAAVERSLHGPSIVEEFEQATLFFWKLTGISIRSELTPLGFFPTKYTAQDLERVRNWCRHNCDRIYWDEKSHSVLVER